MILVHTQIAFKLSGSGVVKGSSPLPLESSNPNEDVGSHGVKTRIQVCCAHWSRHKARNLTGDPVKVDPLQKPQCSMANFSGMKGK